MFCLRCFIVGMFIGALAAHAAWALALAILG